MLGEESEVDKLVESAHTHLTMAWEILKTQDPEGDAYSELRLLTKDLADWQVKKAIKYYPTHNPTLKGK